MEKSKILGNSFREKGFSLIETLTTIFILGILLGTSVLYLKRYERGKSLDNSCLQVAADLEWAQSRAMNTGKIHKVLFNQNSNQYEIVNLGTNNRVERSLPGNVTLVSNLDSLRFLPQGKVEVDTITLSNSEGTKKVFLNSLGETSISH